MRLITEFHEFHEFNIKLNVRTFGISMKYCWVLVKFAKVNEKEYLRNNFGFGRFERGHVGLALYLHVLKRMSFKDMVYVQSTKTEIHFQEKFGEFKNLTKAQKYLIPINRIHDRQSNIAFLFISCFSFTTCFMLTKKQRP